MSITAIYPDDATQLEGFEGESFNWRVEVKDNGVLVDVSGATFDFVLGSLTEASSGVTVSGSSLGIITLTITNTAMAAITHGTHDIALQYTIGTLTRMCFSGTYTQKESYL